MNNMKKLLALLLCLVLAVSCAISVFAEGEASGEPATEPIPVGRYVTFNSTGLVTIYKAVDGHGFNSMVSALGDTFIALYQYAGADGSIWYELDTSNWPEAYRNNKFVKAADITLGDSIQAEPEHNELNETVGNNQVTVSGLIPENVRLYLASAEIDPTEFGIEDPEDIITALDIKLMDGETVWQPAEGSPVTITLDAAALGMSDGDEFMVYHQHEGEITVSDVYTVENGLLSFETDGFSIYVVVGNYTDNWNYNNYQIVMTVGDRLQLSTSTNGSSYSWSITGGDSNSFSLTNTNRQQATITANAEGEVTLQCIITTRNNRTTTENIKVVALPSVGNTVDDDIIFANIDKEYTSGDTEYENTYGPYVMKIRFEDTDGNVLKYADGTTVGEDYYVFDSAVPINLNTFAAIAPDGYTYSGSFFYWSGHYSGTKSYVSEVTRLSSLGSYGSYLYFDYIVAGESTVHEDVEYQPSGVLHIVYAKSDESYSVVFKDHDRHELQSYVVLHNDNGNKVPAAYIATLKDTLLSGIESHHNIAAPGYEFSGEWVVTGGSQNINGTYTTDEIIAKLPTWNITSNITITAQCEEPPVTINYTVVDNIGGTVSPTSETVKVASESAAGSTATAGNDYVFVGWYANEDGTGDALSTNTHFMPEKVDGKNIPATYYAKFEEKKVTIRYEVVGPDGCGSVDLSSETLDILSGMASGSNAAANADYTFIGWYSDQACTTQVGTDTKYTPEKVNDKNVAATYYAKFVENEVTINYVAVGPDGVENFGTVSRTTETVKVLTGNAQGSTADPNDPTFKFVGWYKDENCTELITTVADYNPAKVDGKNVAATYYAKFEYNLTTLTVSKEVSGTVYDKDDTFIFQLKDANKQILATFTLQNGQSVTIKDVTVGATYTVTELDTGNRYSGACTKNITINADASKNVIEFTNTANETKWLSATDVVKNIFGSSKG